MHAEPGERHDRDELLGRARQRLRRPEGLQSKTKYGVDSTPSTLGLTLEYRGLDSYADEVGMDWRYWPCQGISCASQCRGTGACLMKPEFTRFWCGGYPASVVVRPGAATGTGSVRWNVDVPYDRYGSSVLMHDRSEAAVRVR